MAAVIHPTETLPAPLHPAVPRRARPALRVIEGGRSDAARAAQAATFRRRRLVAGLALVTVVTVVVLLVQSLAGLAAGWAAPSSAPISGPTVVVEAEPGDTLWTLAREARPTGDVRPAVEAMIAERGGADLQVGEQVRVPVG